jgi:hypothetical protein
MIMGHKIRRAMAERDANNKLADLIEMTFEGQNQLR